MKYPIKINPYKKILYFLSTILLFISLFIFVVMLALDDFDFNGIMISLIMFIFFILIAYWAFNMKIIVHENHFLQYSFLPAKKIYFSDVIEINVSYGHNGPFSPVNMTQIISSKGIKSEINNFIYKEEDRQLLLELINNSASNQVKRSRKFS